MWRTGDTLRRALEPVLGLPAANRQRRTTRETAHRPWPLPADRPWVMGQTWEDLLFAHWPVPAAELRRVLPPQVPLDEHDGTAWLGVTPFEVRGLRGRLTPPAPLASRFGEVNVRTYATVDGKPGIWFFSLDAASWAAVAAARRTYRLPYHRARMRIARDGAGVRFASERVPADAPPAALDLDYAPTGPVFNARAGSLEHFLTERYCLYTLDAAGRLLRADIHHPPWPLQTATATVRDNTMAAPLGLALDRDPPLLHYAARQDVVVWPVEPAD